MESAESDSQYPQEGFAGGARSRWRKKRWAIPSMLLAILMAVLIAAWFSRYSIADNIIQDQLDAYDLPGTYEIERIGGRTQVITNLVIGDPAAPGSDRRAGRGPPALQDRPSRNRVGQAG